VCLAPNALSLYNIFVKPLSHQYDNFSRRNLQNQQECILQAKKVLKQHTASLFCLFRLALFCGRLPNKDAIRHGNQAGTGHRLGVYKSKTYKTSRPIPYT
jgi:hypothetical protein